MAAHGSYIPGQNCWDCSTSFQTFVNYYYPHSTERNEKASPTPLFIVVLVQKRPVCIILVLLLIAFNKKWGETVIHLATVSMCQEDWKKR